MRAIIKIGLVFPYKIGIESLLRLATIWDCDLIKISTKKKYQLIAMPWKHFNDIWGSNPYRGKWHIPENTEDFIESVEVIKVTGDKRI
jgi:hypothetical protein